MITQIEIGGYRLLNEFEADLNPLTVVIGANAVGKSTLIDCLQLIGECCEYPLNTAIGWHHGPGSLLTAGNGNGQLAWSVTFHKPPVWDDFPLAEGKVLVYEVVLQADAQGQMHPQYEVLRSQEPVHGEPLKFLEATPYQQHIFDIEQRRLIPFDEAQSSPDVVRDADSVVAPPGSGRAGAQQEPVALLLITNPILQRVSRSFLGTRSIGAYGVLSGIRRYSLLCAPYQGRRYQTGYNIMEERRQLGDCAARNTDPL